LAAIECSPNVRPWQYRATDRAGYFIAPDEYEEFRRFKQHRRCFATADLSDERVQAIGSSRMDERHAHLDDVLEPK
jgi:hypothetical protein